MDKYDKEYDNMIWVVLTIFLVIGFGLLFYHSDLKKTNDDFTQFEDCKIYAIDDRRAVLNCTESKLLCEVME